ncbi:Nitrate reductase cytochrome c550-type subunit [Caenispirillum salinarum AK4]|uniref:Periplasmic nitrate reductase, electron transfer subunit n=1 Tax=Caenispirillum salinarum AK4 TaxID=1238182 RepID=K9GTZ6_9PROT|nr:nitrate reductase cytochrome c-type subunit [Caenispirillum salinarum]EKV29470.1 Nitrate reductase cytochrome c550-type subunit [Caenispirillum salinarum AK4]
MWTRKTILSAALALVAAGAASAALAQSGLEDGLEPTHPLTGPNPLPQVTPADPMPPEVVDEQRVRRGYPEQPPVIPHRIRDYQIDLNTNKCLTCHAREFAPRVQAPMISVTHFMDRDQQMLAGVAPRRYTCRQCHVPQTKAVPPIPNTFMEIGTLAIDEAQGGGD